MNINVKDSVPVPVLFLCIIVIGLLFSIIPAQPQYAEVATIIPVVIQEGQAVNLADLPESMVLPNGVMIEGVDFTEEGAGIISAIISFNGEEKSLKMSWLDKSGNQISYTVLNNPPYGAESGGEIKIWSTSGAEQVKFEVWK